MSEYMFYINVFADLALISVIIRAIVMMNHHTAENKRILERIDALPEPVKDKIIKRAKKKHKVLYRAPNGKLMNKEELEEYRAARTT